MKGKKAHITAWILGMLCLWPLAVQAALTDEQYFTLKQDITVVHATEFAADVAAGNDQAIAMKYNLPASAAFWVWRLQLAEKEVYEATADGASWSWQTYKSQTVQDRDSWARMWGPGVVNPSLKQTRDGWLAIFGGQGASQTQVNFLLALARRQATRAEKLFATTPGTGTTADPALTTFAGQLTSDDVRYALRGGEKP